MSQEITKPDELEVVSFTKKMWFIGEINDLKDEYVMQIAECMDKIAKRFGYKFKNIKIDCDIAQLDKQYEYAIKVDFAYSKEDQEGMHKLLETMKK